MESLKNRLNESLTKVDGTKWFRHSDGIGKSKYGVSSHDGESTHKDGSPFYDIKLFKSKKAKQSYIDDLISKGYKESRA